MDIWVYTYNGPRSILIYYENKSEYFYYEQIKFKLNNLFCEKLNENG